MSKKSLVVIVTTLLVLAGCKSPDNASKWVGISGTNGGVYQNTFNQIVIQESSNNTIRIAADTLLPGGTVYTYTTIQNASVQSSTSATFDETDAFLGFTNPFLFNGTATLNGNTLTIIGTGVSTTDTIAYYFYGTKQ